MTDLESFKAMLDRRGTNHYVKSTPDTTGDRKTIVLYCGAYGDNDKRPHFHFAPDGSFEHVEIEAKARP